MRWIREDYVTEVWNPCPTHPLEYTRNVGLIFLTVTQEGWTATVTCVAGYSTRLCYSCAISHNLFLGNNAHDLHWFVILHHSIDFIMNVFSVGFNLIMVEFFVWLFTEYYIMVGSSMGGFHANESLSWHSTSLSVSALSSLWLKGKSFCETLNLRFS